MSKKNDVDEATQDLDFKNKKYQIHLETTAGAIDLDLLPEVAPEHCRNMIGLARIGFYDGLIFHRVIEGFMIQGGCPEGTGTGNPGYSVKAEFNDTPHVAGVLSAARSQSPDSAGSQFFVCLGTHEYLDGQYTAFGRATADSMATVESIGKTQTGSDDRPATEMKITQATVIES